MSDLVVTNATDRNRYEAHLDGQLVGFSVYQIDGDVVSFTHARTYSEFAHRGYASEMARASLDDARAEQRAVRPVCSFYRWYIDQHPEYADLVA
ncbi:MAG: GNAT family N-acetyltransferase [Nocardioidaceae bacterium]